MNRMLVYGVVILSLVVLSAKFIASSPLKMSFSNLFSENIEKPNFLVINVSGLRKDHIGIYGYSDRITTPSIDEFFNTQAVVFNNYFTAQSWTNIFQYEYWDRRPSLIQQNGYTSAGVHWNQFLTSIPFVKTEQPWRRSDSIFNSRYSRINFSQQLDLVRPVFKKTNREKPFFLALNLNLLSFPLIGNSQQIGEWGRYLNETDIERIETLKKKSILDNSELALAVLLNAKKFSVDTAPAITAWKKKFSRPISDETVHVIAFSKSMIELWKKSRTYQSDLRLLRKIYDANLLQFDFMFKNIVSDLQASSEIDNTVIVLTSDHGQPLGENDHFLASSDVSDRTMNVPLMIRSPQKKSKFRMFEGQFSESSAIRLIAYLFENPSDNKSLIDKAKNLGKDDSLVVFRDCGFKNIAMRYKNRWKLVSNHELSTQKLLNIKVDKEETENILNQKRNLKVRIEQEFYNNFHSILVPSPMKCEPWKS